MKSSSLSGLKFGWGMLGPRGVGVGPHTAAAGVPAIVCSEVGLNNAIAAAPVAGTITFTGNCTITLTSQVVINKSITIDGGGFVVIIDGNSTTRVFDVTAGTVVLDRLIVRNGLINPAAGDNDENGANIRNAATLTIRNSAILNGDVSGGDFFDNEGFGGGISTGDGSVLNVVNSTIAGNIAEQGGGAIAVPSGFSATITIANATLINNLERSGLDGGGLSVPSLGAEPIVKNSIIANNISTGFGLRNTLQTITSQGYNISDDDLQPPLPQATNSPPPALSRVSGRAAVPTNTSPAIDRGNPAGCTDHASVPITTEQRGNARNDLRCDVGAVEFVFADGDTVIKSVAVDTTESFGPTLAQITAMLAVATRRHPIRKVPKRVQESGEMPVQWRITPAGSSSGLTIDLGLCYTAAELRPLRCIGGHLEPISLCRGWFSMDAYWGR